VLNFPFLGSHIYNIRQRIKIGTITQVWFPE